MLFRSGWCGPFPSPRRVWVPLLRAAKSGRKKFKKISKKACKTQDLVVRYSGTTAKGENPPVLGAGGKPVPEKCVLRPKRVCRAGVEAGGCGPQPLEGGLAGFSVEYVRFETGRRNLKQREPPGLPRQAVRWFGGYCESSNSVPGFRPCADRRFFYVKLGNTRNSVRENNAQRTFRRR